MVQRFTRELNLNEAQQAQVRSIFDAKRQQLVALHAQVRPQFDIIRKETSDQIRGVLTPEQAKQYDEMEAKHEAKRRKYGEKFFGESVPNTTTHSTTP
jgi:Spy/CpxP family protein refolding chaperone